MNEKGGWVMSIRPGEWGILLITFLLSCLSLLGLGHWSTGEDVPIYLGFFLVYVLVLTAAWARGEGPASRTLRIGTTVLATVLLYGAMADIAFRWIPYNFDARLLSLDRGIFRVLGLEPTWAGVYSRPVLEITSWIYVFFLVYFYAAMIFGFIFRAKEEREILYSNLVLLYTVSYFGYFLLPARGPIASALGEPLGGGSFHHWVLHLVQTGGGPHGAMPSVHAAAPAYFCIHDLSRGRWTGRVAVALVCAIGFSTLVLRYHYLSDFLAGVLIAWACHHFGTKITKSWLKSRAARYSGSRP